MGYVEERWEKAERLTSKVTSYSKAEKLLTKLKQHWELTVHTWKFPEAPHNATANIAARMEILKSTVIVLVMENTRVAVQIWQLSLLGETITQMKKEFPLTLLQQLEHILRLSPNTQRRLMLSESGLLMMISKLDSLATGRPHWLPDYSQIQTIG